jgi:hypothetical protein
MLSYSQITTFVFCKLKDEEHLYKLLLLIINLLQVFEDHILRDGES